MSALTSTFISAVTHDYIYPYVADNWFKASPLLKLLWGKKRPADGGNTIGVPVQFSKFGKAATWDGGLTTITVTNVLPIYRAQFNWKYHETYWAFEVQEDVKTAGKHSVIDLVKFKAKEATKDLSDKIATGLYSNGCEAGDLGTQGVAETGTIQGLRALCQATDPGSSNSYGGFDVATYTQWAATEISATSTTRGGDGSTFWSGDKNDLSAIIRDVSYTKDDRPDYLFCNKTSYGYIKSLFDDYIRYTNPDKPSLGFGDFDIEGDVRVTWDPYCPDNTAFLINSEHLWIAHHPDYAMRAGERVSMEAAGTIGQVQFIYFVGNLVCDSRNRFASIRNIPTSF